MSLQAFMDTVASIKHRDADNDTVSPTGEVTPDYDNAGTSVKVHFIPSPPSWTLEAYGLPLEANAVIYLPAGTDIRPDLEDSNGYADQVTINGKAYTVLSVVNPSGRDKLLVAALRRGGI